MCKYVNCKKGTPEKFCNPTCRGKHCAMLRGFNVDDTMKSTRIDRDYDKGWDFTAAKELLGRDWHEIQARLD